MAIEANYLSVYVKGNLSSSLVVQGLRVAQIVDADGLAFVDFRVDGTALGWDYDGGTTDRVELVSATGDVVTLTRVGDYWRWTVTPEDLRGGENEPGTTFTSVCQIVVTRTTAGDTASNAPGRWTSREFTVTVDRKTGFSPDQIAGLGLWLDGYSFVDDASATAEAAWDDKSVYDRDMAQGTGANQPLKYTDGKGRPYLLFDGTNDAMATAWALFGDPNTVFVVAQLVSVDATTRGIVQVGGTGGVRIAFNSSNIMVKTGSDSQNDTLPALNTTFVGCATKAASGDGKYSTNLGSQVTATSTQAVTDGICELGDTTADSAAAIRLYEVIVYDTVLSAENRARVTRYLMKKWGVGI